ncbi:MAG: excinuclease ABC subunit UvrA, partial [Bacteroidetes bacterium]|nr:excinuclease ABC subunit UvrA [Bacteroidota bacterium]
GLSYLKLGQRLSTLSGGEAQRLKISSYLSGSSEREVLFVLDEPTTGLHFEEIGKLLDVLLELRDRGNSVIVVEHNLDVIKCADYVIDLGPEAGDEGGKVVATGTPEEIMIVGESRTGVALKKVLGAV